MRRRRSARAIATAGAALFAAALAQASEPAAECAPELPASVAQGGLVLGRTRPDCRVELDGRALRVGDDGTFVFGVGRDEAGPVELHAGPRRGPLQVHRLAVSPRDWRIERVDGVPPDTVEPPPAIAARIAREQARVTEARRRDDDRRDFRFGFVRPLAGRISGVYGSQRVLNGVPKNPHYGLDIAAPEGTAVRAPAGGVVTLAEPDFYLTGGTVLLDHGHGLSSVFIHLSRIDVESGRRLEQGEVLGAVGMTGRATGPHLHWGVNWFEVRLDPALLLPGGGD